MKKISRYLFLFLIFFLSGNIIKVSAQKSPKPDDTTYMLTYDHGGLILWGSEHFRERLRNAIALLDKYPSFKIGLDNEAQIYDYFAENDVILTGLYPKKGMVVARFFKSDDRTPRSPLHFEKKDTKMVETNLDGKFIRNLDGKIDLKPWEIKTIQIPIN